MRKFATVVAALTLVTLGAPTADAATGCGAFSGVVFPGGPGLTKSCEVDNNGTVDATFYYSISNVQLFDENNNPQSVSAHADFVDDWRVSVDTQVFATLGSTDLLKLGFTDSCTDRAVNSFQFSGPGSPVLSSACNLSYARRDGAPLGFDRRAFTVNLRLCDCGDQTAYAGWGISFTEHFTARIPAVAANVPFDPAL